MTVIFWTEWAHNKRESGVRDDTGYPYQLLELIWDRPAIQNEVSALKLLSPYNLWEDHPGGADTKIALFFYVALWYIHQYPNRRSIGGRDWRYFGRLTDNHFYDYVCDVLIRFSQAINEIDYNWRFHPKNHGAGNIFNRFVTCFVDTTPLFVKQPTDDDLRQRLFHKKYMACVYKIQVAVNFLGWICYWSGPHEGNINDNVSKRVLVQSDCGFVQVIYAATLHEHPLRSWEFWCGDGIYNSCYGVITRFVLQAGQVFTRAMVAVNTWISHYRQRVEHVMASIKAHAMFKRKFSGSKAMLTAAITLTMHMTSAKIRHAWDEEAYHKYQGFNTPWEWPLHIP